VVTPSLFGLLAGHADTRPDAPFLTYARGDEEGRRWSYADAVGATARVVAGLREAGLAPAEPYVVCLENRPFMVTALLAASACGMVAVYADPRLTDHELDHVFALSGARVAFGGRGNQALATAATRAEARLLLVDDASTEGSAVPGWPRRPVPVRQGSETARRLPSRAMSSSCCSPPGRRVAPRA